MEYTDLHRDLIEQCRRGERNAFREVYRLYSKSMFNVALRMTGMAHIAEDVLQEAFADAFTSLDKFRNDSTFGAWLKRIVVFKSYDYLNSRVAGFEFLEDMEQYDSSEPEPEFSEEQLANEVKRIKEAVAKLPAGSRTVLTLYLFEGYDHEEISQILGISESTSKTQYMRAKQKVKELLTQSHSHER
ncbi:ECF RNA polymerase sigma factor SigW [bioreactor metagenome]|uniref:ECF RNA polymerase sigma factor SigW n=1 Tax=bioreactor metagenome TaxID=1076179 RepID=A0A644WG56_9ZZZZ